MPSDPGSVLPGTIVVTVPHMDDEIIGVGGILASLPDPSRVHLVYATDGSRSPEPAKRGVSVDRRELARVRRSEALEGLRILGVPPGQAHFLDLPDGGLDRLGSQLREGLVSHLDTIAPDVILTPFRFDGHPDHLAVHRAVWDLHEVGAAPARVLEYFVYTRWRLLRGTDIRTRIRPELLVNFPLSEEARRVKREALERHATQTTRYFPWQRRPNLTDAFLSRVCSEDEALLAPDPGGRTESPFTGGDRWIRVVHALEPRLKRVKDRAVALLGGGR